MKHAVILAEEGNLDKRGPQIEVCRNGNNNNNNNKNNRNHNNNNGRNNIGIKIIK